ncbi:MAG: SRPBCC domain-containing protein [Planctomycetota bacterium]|nr:SRPBCC domain-containing protein [Planctomycetota bacterium]
MDITVETTIAATSAEVWRAFTTPADICAWNAASDDWQTTEATVDLTPGGSFSFHMAARDGSMAFDLTGTYSKVEEPTELVYALEDGRSVRVSFEPVEAGVRVRQTFTPETTFTPQQQRTGWQAILDRFRAHVEG